MWLASRVCVCRVVVSFLTGGSDCEAVNECQALCWCMYYQSLGVHGTGWQPGPWLRPAHIWSRANTTGLRRSSRCMCRAVTARQGGSMHVVSLCTSCMHLSWNCRWHVLSIHAAAGHHGLFVACLVSFSRCHLTFVTPGSAICNLHSCLCAGVVSWFSLTTASAGMT